MSVLMILYWCYRLWFTEDAGQTPKDSDGKTVAVWQCCASGTWDQLSPDTCIHLLRISFPQHISTACVSSKLIFKTDVSRFGGKLCVTDKSSTAAAACPRLRWAQLQSSSFFFQFTELHLIWKMVHLSHSTHILWAVSGLFNFAEDRECNESILSTAILLTRCSCVE